MHQKNLHLVNFYPDVHTNIIRPILTEHWYCQLCAFRLINSSITTRNHPADGFVSVGDCFPGRALIAVGSKTEFEKWLMLISRERFLGHRSSASPLTFLWKSAFCRTSFLGSFGSTEEKLIRATTWWTVTGEGGGATSKEKVFRKQSLDQGFDITCFNGSLNVSQEMRSAKETTSRGGWRQIN